jgi:two-component system, sensor histidine kinase RegB
MSEPALKHRPVEDAPGAVVRLFGSPGLMAQRSRGDLEKIRLALLVRLRWVALFGQVAVVVPALRLGWLEQRFLPAYLGTVLGLFAYNAWSSWALKRDIAPPRSVLLPLSIDLVALAVLLVLSGGAWNPLAPIFIVHAGLGALVLHGWRSIAFAGLLVLVAAVVSLVPSLPPAAPAKPTSISIVLPSLVLVALTVWALTAWMAAGLAAQRRVLENMRDQQLRVDRLRASGALAAGFSHEFSTPLNTLKMRLERLGRQELPGSADKDVAAAREAAERCEGVLRSMVGRQLNPKKVRLEQVELAGLVERVCDSWATGGRAVRVAIEGEHGHMCLLPTLPLTRAILDLLDNAAEASPNGGNERDELQVQVTCSGDVCKVAVLDRGPGWPTVVRENLGQPFLTTKPDGTGLGLYAAHSLAQALGGGLELGERDGGGAIAAFRIPCDEHAGFGDES